MSDRPGEPSATVLVVDDNLQNREVAEGHLVGAGYQAVQAESGEAGARAPAGRRRSSPTSCCSTCSCRASTASRPVAASARCRAARASPSCSSRRSAISGRTRRRSTRAPTTSSRSPSTARSSSSACARSCASRQLSDEQPRNLEVISSQRDALIEAQRQKEELTALIIHDLKNPLSSILSNVQFALGQQAPRRRRARVAARRPARVAVDGAHGHEPARHQPQRGRRARAAHVRVRAARPAAAR